MGGAFFEAGFLADESGLHPPFSGRGLMLSE